MNYAALSRDPERTLMYRLYPLLALLLIISCAHKQSQPQIGSSHAALTADQYSTLKYEPCSAEWQTCSFAGTRVVRFGAPGSYVYVVATGSIQCRYDVLGDPLPGKTKTCSVSTVDPTAGDPEPPPPPEMDAGTGCCCCCNGKPVDAGVVFDAGVDAGSDAGVDAGKDAGVADSGQRDTGTPAGGTAPRPATSTGVGFYVVGRNVYDGNGRRFVMRGTNKTHQDVFGGGLGKTKSNTTRWVIYFNDADRFLRDMQSPNIGGSTTNGKAVAVGGLWQGTCKSDIGTFNSMVNQWVAWAPKMQTVERYFVLNIANEWGADHVAWRNAYVSAIPKIRAAGFRGMIQVDAPGCGQDGVAIANHGEAILAADPERNVQFSWHVYGRVHSSKIGVGKTWQEQIDYVPTLDAIMAKNLALVIGEFGPKSDGKGPIFPSPTAVPPEHIVEEAEARGVSWLTWSWDDNSLANGKCADDTFCHAYDPAVYNSQADLTNWGKIAVGLWEKYGARPATVF